MLEDDDMPVDDAPEDEGEGGPRHTYNFAPGNYGIVYRADVPDRGAGPSRERPAGGKTTSRSKANEASATVTEAGADTDADANAEDGDNTTTSQDTTHYKLQSMKWGLIPFWTKRNPDYASMLKTINCRDDSLANPGGMWATMKARKRCIVVAQGFYEWLRPGGPGTKEKVPHFVKRKDGKLMCFAGLWDCVAYEGEEGRYYTYTVITTDSNKQLKFLREYSVGDIFFPFCPFSSCPGSPETVTPPRTEKKSSRTGEFSLIFTTDDRMPVILDQGSEGLRTWLDPGRYEWNKELQGLLKPYEGELEVYPVSKEVGKVGNNSPSFVIPVASRENRNNIANFFAKGTKKGELKDEGKVKPEVEVVVKKEEGEMETEAETVGVDELEKTADDGGMGSPRAGVKREATSSPGDGEPPVKKLAHATSPVKMSPSPAKGKPHGRAKISATSNSGKSPAKKKGKADGSQKITKFFGSSA